MPMNPCNFLSLKIRVNAYASESSNILDLEIHDNAFAQDPR
jgi:hypothetical protein